MGNDLRYILSIGGEVAPVEVEKMGYKVVTLKETGKMEAETLSLAELLSTHTQTGVNNNPRTRSELQGLPTFADLCGPMFDGFDASGRAVIRYESVAAYARLSA